MQKARDLLICIILLMVVYGIVYAWFNPPTVNWVTYGRSGNNVLFQTTLRLGK